jgi:sortase A
VARQRGALRDEYLSEGGSGMRVFVAREPLKRLLRWNQRTLLVFGVSLMAYCGYVLMDTWNFQRTEQRRFEGLLIDRIATPASRNYPLPPASSGLIGRIEISRLGLSVIVIEGTSGTTLRRAVGHIPGTAMPGQLGNIGISGHRDTFFRPLRNILQNDIVTLTTLNGVYRYRVISTSIVSPSDVAVLSSNGNETLTLVTCYPFYFVGAAPDRFIVRAERIG